MLNPYAFYGKIHGRKMVLMLRGGKIPCSCWAFVSLLLGSFSSSELSELNNLFFGSIHVAFMGSPRIHGIQVSIFL